jgi:hypothetical protein
MELKNFTNEELEQLLWKHELWLEGKEGGVPADLSGSNLTGSVISLSTKVRRDRSWEHRRL